MTRLTLRTAVILGADLILIVICFFQFPRLLELPWPPFDVRDDNGRMVITRILDQSTFGDLRVGDEILTWDGQSLLFGDHLIHLAGQTSNEESATIVYRREGATSSTTVATIRLFDPRSIVIYFVIAVITWLVGIYVLLSKPGNLVAEVLHWAMISLAVVVALTRESAQAANHFSYITSALYFASYGSVAASFLLFTTLFPREKWGSLSLKVGVIFLPALILLTPVLFYYFRGVIDVSGEDIAAFNTWHDFFDIALLIYVGGGILNFVHSFATTTSSEERKKLKWILFGLCVGPTPFLVFTKLSDVVAPEWSVPEEYTQVFLIIIPTSFAISFVKYHLLDIELVLRRTTSYAILVGGLLLFYVLLVTAVASTIGQGTASALAAIFVALLFHPARIHAQRVVDKRFFRVRYNYREAERELIAEMKRALDLHQLAEQVISKIDELIPVERLAFFTVKGMTKRLRTVAHRGWSILEKHGVQFHAEQLRTALNLPVALSNTIETGVQHEPADREVFQRWGMALVLPMLSKTSDAIGFLVLGEKKSGTRFTSEDTDLLSNVAAHAGLMVERLALQEKLMLERAETERLEELNRLKSDFVSYVSHELSTPLTSIKMFTELLRSRQKAKSSREYLEVIEGETDRLSRMVSTILNSAKIDQGVQHYTFEDEDLRMIAQIALKAMRYQLNKHGFVVKCPSSPRSLPVRADRDAMVDAIINLIGNSIKYSGEKKYLKVSLRRERHWAFCHIQDRGSGITPNALPHIFEKFYRDPGSTKMTEGVGLGLPMVKHIMDAHGGKIELESTPGKGTTMSLGLPLRQSRNGKKKTNSRR